MLKNKFIILIGSIILVYSSASLASPFGYQLGLGTRGVYGSFSIKENTNFSTNLEISGLDIDPDFQSGGENYHLKLSLLSYSIAQDWHPFNNGFFLSTGILFNGNTYNLQPSSSNTGNYSFATPASVKYNKINPFIGMGYNIPFTRNNDWQLNLFAGAAYQGNANVNVSMGTDRYAEQSYMAEKENLQKSFDNLTWYPLVQAGISYSY